MEGSMCIFQGQAVAVHQQEEVGQEDVAAPSTRYDVEVKGSSLEQIPGSCAFPEVGRRAVKP